MSVAGPMRPTNESMRSSLVKFLHFMRLNLVFDFFMSTDFVNLPWKRL